MRILQINKFFYRRGGAEVVFLDTIKGLRERSHEVSEFAMSHQKNLPSDFSAYFASEIPELQDSHDMAIKWKIFRRLFRSKEIEKKLKALILSEEPQVAHVHNAYHHLSADTFLQLKKMNVPTVLTVHDVFPLCPNHSMLKGETLCESCYKNKLYNCVRYKCVNNKFWPSVAGTLEAYYYRIKKIWNNIDLYVCPSQFIANKFVEWGFPKDKMRVVKNPFVASEQVMPLGDTVVYMGRIHYEKGIKIFMEACKQLKNYKILIAGNGPEDAWVKEFIRKNNLANVEKIDWVTGNRWQEVIAKAKAFVVPSLFYENCSLSILEAMSNGRIVVTTNRGGNPELIKDGQTGFLAKPENPDDLSRAVKKAMDLSGEESKTMIANARKLVIENHSPDEYFSKLKKIYEEVAK